MEHLLLNLNEEDHNPKDKNRLPVILNEKVYKKMVYWTQVAGVKHNCETAGIGTCYKRYGGYYISKIWMIPPVSVNGAYVAQDPVKIHELMMREMKGTGEMVKKGNNISFKGGTSPERMIFCWHTHANFDVFWSGTDKLNALWEFCPNANWTINLVTNTMGHFLARKDFPKANYEKAAEGKLKENGIGTDTGIDNLPVKVLIPMSKSLTKTCHEEYYEAHSGIYPFDKEAKNPNARNPQPYSQSNYSQSKTRNRLDDWDSDELEGESVFEEPQQRRLPFKPISTIMPNNGLNFKSAFKE